MGLAPCANSSKRYTRWSVKHRSVRGVHLVPGTKLWRRCPIGSHDLPETALPRTTALHVGAKASPPRAGATASTRACMHSHTTTLPQLHAGSVLVSCQIPSTLYNPCLDLFRTASVPVQPYSPPASSDGSSESTVRPAERLCLGNPYR